MHLCFSPERIQVNDQIVEVDGISLVGVTQNFAATVLRNTKEKVRWVFSKEKRNFYLILKIAWLPSQAFQFAQVELGGFGLCVFSLLIPREGSNTLLQFCFGFDF